MKTHWKDLTEHSFRACKECTDYYTAEYVEEITGVGDSDESWDVCPTCGSIEQATTTIHETKDLTWVRDEEIDWNGK